MNRAIIIVAVVAGVFAIGGPPTLAVPGDPVPTAYRLGTASTFQHGCFDPCLCPLFEELPTSGSFSLTFTGFDGLFWNYDAAEVDWTVWAGSEPYLSISGSGTYRVGGEFVSQHRLELDLVLGDNPVAHFDSGLIIGGGNFPAFDIVISMNGLYCYDNVFNLQARPQGDLDLDGDVDEDDLEMFSGVLLGTDVDQSHVAMADVNLDGKSDGEDIRPFLDAMILP